jgi:hypothetical protein
MLLHGSINKMKKTLNLVLAVSVAILSSSLTSAQSKSDSALSREDASKKLGYIESWSSGKTNDVPGNVRIDQAIAELQKNPEVSMPLLAEAFTDGKRDQRFRVAAGQILREIVKPLPPEFDARLEMVIKDSAEPPSIRIYAAHLRLAPGKDVSTAVKNSILDMAEKFIREGKDDGNLRLLVFSRLVGNERAGQIMVQELQKGKEVDSTLWVLGKIKAPSSIASIATVLSKKQARGATNATKTRGYLALGEIGGAKAYDLLSGYLAHEKDRRQQRLLLRAVGLTHDPRAKQLLLDYLLKKRGQYYTSALRGLEYLGDPSVVPVLEEELKKPLDEHTRFKIHRAIESVQKGPVTAEW